ncbi:hypothetical protein [Dysgonomonas sp. 511]|uniref:hypothetical protein n=1 Tax=Dysgonomonas sp. 511 TaxID=2302930 RepID=UPI0013D7ABAC|nr:hypothetical protein [Dysgonomonas sp. 511]
MSVIGYMPDVESLENPIDKYASQVYSADGGAMFGAIPKRAWQRKYGADEDNL